MQSQWQLWRRLTLSQVTFGSLLAGFALLALYFAVGRAALQDENAQLKNELLSVHRQAKSIETYMARVGAYNEMIDEMASAQIDRDADRDLKTRDYLAMVRDINNKLRLYQNEEDEKRNLTHRLEDIVQVASRAERSMRTMTVLLSHHTELLATIPSVTPVQSGWLSSFFGDRKSPFSGEDTVHRGIDFGAEEGTAVFAAADGEVYFAGMSDSFGKLVVIKHANNVYTKYAHNSKILVTKGTQVHRGQNISEVGTTGRSTGDHLHYEVWIGANAVDPMNYLLDRELVDTTAFAQDFSGAAKASIVPAAETPQVPAAPSLLENLFIVGTLTVFVVLGFVLLTMTLRLQRQRIQA